MISRDISSCQQVLGAGIEPHPFVDLGGREDVRPTVTARKCSLRRLCFYRCLSVHRGGRGVLSQHALQVVSHHALQQVSWGVVSQHALQVSRPTPKGEFRGIWPGGVSPGPHPIGKLRGIWSRPTPKGEV